MEKPHKFVIFSATFLLIFYLIFSNDLRQGFIIKGISLKFESIKTVTKVKVEPGNGRNIFFVESSYSAVNVTLNVRQACAIESAALTNPDMKIFFF
jgi:hypothetical protein